MAKRKTEDPVGTVGSKAVLKRNSKGTLKATYKSDFGGITQKTMQEDRLRAKGTGNGMYNGTPAPRVGGKQTMIAKSGAVKGGTKSMVKASKRRVGKSSASPQAKRSAKKLY